jgi:membrane protein
VRACGRGAPRRHGAPFSSRPRAPESGTVAARMDLKAPEIPPWLRTPRRIAHRVYVEVQHDSIAIVAAGVAFYAVLAVLPALFIAVSLYGLFTDPGEVERQLDALLAVLPGTTAQIFDDQMRSIAETSNASLSVGFAVSLAALAWTVSNGTRALVRGVKIAYDQEEQKSRLERRDVAIGITLAAIVIGLLALAIIAAVPVWLNQFDPTDSIVTFGNFRWLLVGAGFATIAGLLYRYAPPERPGGWRSVMPGVVVAATVWTVASIGFSIYVSSFGSYNETYGTLGAAVVLLLWFWFTSLAILLGAELNETLATDRQTGSDA